MSTVLTVLYDCGAEYTVPLERASDQIMVLEQIEAAHDNLMCECDHDPAPLAPRPDSDRNPVGADLPLHLSHECGVDHP